MSAGGILAAVAAPVVALNVPSFMQFTASDWAMIIGAIGLVVTSWRQGNKTDKVIAAVVGTEASKGVIGKLDQIHDVGNATLGEVRNELKVSQTLNLELRDIIRDLQTERSKKQEVDAVAAAKEPAQKL